MNKISKLIIVSLLLLLSKTTYSQVTWNFKGGITKVSATTNIDALNHIGTAYDQTENKIDWMAGLEIEIPLSQKINLETGLRYHNHLSVYENDIFKGRYDSKSSHIELPLRVAYKLPLGKHFNLHIGVGPYAGMLIASQREFGDALHVGLEPSVAINWKCLSLGASYSTPCFHKGYKDLNKNNAMLTLGIRFKSHAWKYIGAGLLAVATAGANASMLYSENTSSGNDVSTSSGYVSSSNGGNYEAQYRNWENRARSHYNSLTNLGTTVKKNGKDAGGSTGRSMSSSNYTMQKKALREAQNEMKKIRSKAAKQGITIAKSEYEDIQVSY